MSSNYVGNPANYPADIPIDDDGDTPHAARTIIRAGVEGLTDRTANTAALAAVHEARLDEHDLDLADNSARIAVAEIELTYHRERPFDVPNADGVTLDPLLYSVFFVGRTIALTADRAYAIGTAGVPLGARVTVSSWTPTYQAHILPGISPDALGVFLKRGAAGNYTWVDLILVDIDTVPTWIVMRGGFNS